METTLAAATAAAAAAPTPIAPADFTKKRKLEEHADNELTREDARKMIEPLSREQLLDILQEATVCHHEVLEDVRKYADQDPIHRKIFVRGLGWDTNTDSLKNVFSQFGELEEGVVIMDKSTGKSRGYGFVTFKHMDGALNALKEPSKRIEGRMTVCQLASTGPSLTQSTQDLAMRKIYVGNIPLDLPADRLLNFFAQYGEIEEGPLGFDKQTGRLRGFALFIYKSSDSAKRALEDPTKLIDRHQIFCKLAVEGQKQQAGAAVQGQLDGSEFSISQPGGGGGAMVASNMHYGGVPQGTPFSRSMNATPIANPPVNPSFNPNLHPHLVGHSQNYAVAAPSSTSPSLANPPYAQSVSPGVSQAQTSLGMPSYGQQAGLSSYGSQVAAYGGQPTAYPGVGAGSMYGMAQGAVVPQTTAVPTASQYGQVVSQTTAPQPGQYGQASQQTMPIQNASHYTQLHSQTSSIQVGQYAQAPYQNQQLAASSASRAPTTGIMPSMPPYYGA